MLSLTAAAGALSYLTAFLQSSTANVGSSSSSNPLSALGQALAGGDADGDGDQSAAPSTAASSGASGPAFNPGMLAALVAMQSQQAGASPNGSGASGLFANLDTNGDGQISKAELESALGSAGVDPSSADALFSKLDTNGDGSVSQSELASARHGHGHHHHHMAGAGQGGGLASLLNPTNADGSTTKTAINADGSTTTTISYADGTTVDMTTSAVNQNSGSSGGGSSTPSQCNLIEQLIRMQAQLLAQSPSTLSAIA